MFFSRCWAGSSVEQQFLIVKIVLHLTCSGTFSSWVGSSPGAVLDSLFLSKSAIKVKLGADVFTVFLNILFNFLLRVESELHLLTSCLAISRMFLNSSPYAWEIVKLASSSENLKAKLFFCEFLTFLDFV